MAWLLDTNVLIALFQDSRGAVGRRLRVTSAAEIYLSTIVLHELYFGGHDGAQSVVNLARIERLRLSVLEFTANDAHEAGAIRAALKAIGRPIGPYDVLIAGQARARDLTLVTNNTREFSRVDGLRLEDWSQPAPA